MSARFRLVVFVALALLVQGGADRVAAQLKTPPLIVVETEKGTFAFETFPDDAPKTVAHIVALVRAGFYDGQRIHRAQSGFLIQFGDPQTRDLAKRDLWGRGPDASSGKPIGVAEITKKRRHDAGAVGIAHTGNPANGDSQIYIMLAPHHELDGRYVVFARLVEGEEVPPTLAVGDRIRRVFVRE